MTAWKPYQPSTAAADRRRGALLIGGAHGSLAVARSLGRQGIPVYFVTNDHQITKYSRYTTWSSTWGGPNQPGAADDLIELARQHGLEGWVLFPGGDSEVRMVAQNHAKLSAVYRVTTPDWDTVQWALDKRLTYQRAAELGIDYPRSYNVTTRRDIAQLDCQFPLILKPTTRFEVNSFTLAKAWRVNDRAELLARYDQAVEAAGVQGVVLQELIPGGGAAQFSYAAVWDRGRPVASLVARRQRQYPIDMGYSSTFVQSIECAEVEQAGEKFLQSLDFHGLAEVEFKYDSRDRRYKILDVNTRGWTWISLGRCAGVDFPYLLWRIANGETVTPLRGAAGASWMLFSRDLVAACQEMALGRTSPVDYAGSFHAPIEFGAFAKDDPLPGLVDLPLLAARLFTRRLPMAAHQLARRAS